MNKVLVRWNALDPISAASEVLPCCASEAWANSLASARPIADETSLIRASATIWRALPEAAWKQAFDSHPRIGQQLAKRSTEQSLRWSAQEQANATTTDATKQALAEANRRYEEKFHRIFIVCATGKSSAEILNILESRMHNDPATELREAAEQQRQITELRLHRWLESDDMSISTHILDTSLGRPAANVPVTLWLSKDAEWILLNETATDDDGRCKRLLPESQPLHPGIYRIRFDTAFYYEQNHLTGLYPWVEIVFTVAPGQTHYHIPLLLTPNGYTTYRGN